MHNEIEKLFPGKCSLMARWYSSALLSLPFVALIYPIGKARLDCAQVGLCSAVTGVVSWKVPLRYWISQWTLWKTHKSDDGLVCQAEPVISSATLLKTKNN